MRNVQGRRSLDRRPGEGTALSPTAERRRRAQIANEVLGLYGLKLTEWANRFTLTGRTGKSAVVDQFGGIWAEAERLTDGPATRSTRR